MSATAISTSGIGKRYELGTERARYRSLRETIAGLGRSKGRSTREWLWALRGVDLDVGVGDVVGVIGRNGSGKSTLLKILSRITEPTEGEATIRGRVGSLLEVGTGFHPEMTGRENVYLNAAILGMRKAETDRRFEEIVSFAGTERFLDTPVKRYSSGMQMRLAFAVAAHIDAEILLVDEVLAVGDLEFQRKCLDKMSQVTRAGRTVLFVSHNLQAVKTLCRSAILLDAGAVRARGDVDSVIGEYIRLGASRAVGERIGPESHLVPPDRFQIIAVELLDHDGQSTGSLMMDEQFSVRVLFAVRDLSRQYRVGMWVRGADGTRLASFVSTDGGRPHLSPRTSEPQSITMHATNAFPPGSYSLEVIAKDRFGDYVDHIDGLTFHVDPVAVGSEPELVARTEGAAWGLVRLPSAWSIPASLLGDET